MVTVAQTQRFPIGPHTIIIIIMIIVIVIIRWRHGSRGAVWPQPLSVSQALQWLWVLDPVGDQLPPPHKAPDSISFGKELFLTRPSSAAFTLPRPHSALNELLLLLKPHSGSKWTPLCSSPASTPSRPPFI